MIIETSAQNINKLENAFSHKYEIKRLETSMIINKKQLKINVIFFNIICNLYFF
jgi:hypothetical protein